MTRSQREIPVARQSHSLFDQICATSTSLARKSQYLTMCHSDRALPLPSLRVYASVAKSSASLTSSTLPACRVRCAPSCQHARATRSHCAHSLDALQSSSRSASISATTIIPSSASATYHLRSRRSGSIRHVPRPDTHSMTGSFNRSRSKFAVYFSKGPHHNPPYPASRLWSRQIPRR